MNQVGIALWLASVERLFQGVQDKVCAHRTADTPTDDPASEDVNDKSDINEPLPARDVGEIGDPELIGPFGLEAPIDPIPWARRCRIAEGGSNELATSHSPQAETTHQPFDGATGHLNAFALQLAPELVSTIHLVAGLPEPLNVGNQKFIAASPSTTQRRITLSGCITPVSGWGNPQKLADWLDPEALAILLDECAHFFLRRSSSA